MLLVALLSKLRQLSIFMKLTIAGAILTSLSNIFDAWSSVLECERPTYHTITE